jgi:outer membrane protein TolC
LQQSFGLSQGIPWPSKLSKRAEVALRNAQVQKYLYDAEKFKLFYKVKQAYYEYYYLARSINIFETNLQLLENIEASVQARYKAGAAESPALIQVQVELGKLEDQLRSLEKLQPALASKLNAAIGREASIPIPWPQDKPEEPPPQEEEALLAILLEDNPELNAARSKIQAAEADQDLAKTQYLPDFGIGANYIQADRRSDMDVRDNGKDPCLLTFQISLPIWTSKYSAAVREAQAEHQSAVNARDDLENELSSDMLVSLYKYDDAARKLNLFRDTLVPKAEQALKTAQRAFSSEKASYLDMIDTERQLLEFRLMEERALVDRNIRLAELEKLCGRELRQTGLFGTSEKEE